MPEDKDIRERYDKKSIPGVELRADGRRVFTKEFKVDQLARLYTEELAQKELAAELDVNEQMISRWKKSYGAEARQQVSEYEGRRPVPGQS